MALTVAQRDRVRDEVGDAPDDVALDDIAATLPAVPPLSLAAAVSLRVLRRRRANLTAAPSSAAIPGVISVGNRNPADLDRQIARLEGELSLAGVDVVSVVSVGQMVRCDRPR